MGVRLYKDNRRKMETTIVDWAYSGIMENEMEITTIVYWDYVGVLDKKWETTIMG